VSKVFISYRRDDSATVAGRIYDHLVQAYGPDNVFKDMDSIPFGIDFRECLSAAVGRCRVLLAVIGRDWLHVTGASGTRRLDDPRDFVRLEIEAALGRGIPVIPVLVGGAAIPGEDQLPEALRSLAYRNALPVRDDPDFHHDMGRLLKGLNQLLQIQGPTAPAAQPVKAQATAATPQKSPLDAIRELIDAERFEEGLAEYRRLPHERRRPALLAELQTKWRDHAHALARDAAGVDHDYAAAAALIEKLPEILRDGAALADYRDKANRLKQLRAAIDDDVENHRHNFRLHSHVAEYRRLNPGDPAINELHQMLGGLPREVANSLGMKFVLVPAGTFWMGDRGRQTQVQLPRDFYIGIYPVTQGQWRAVMGSNPSYLSAPAPLWLQVRGIYNAHLKLFPVEQVSWEDAQEFIKRLNARDKSSGLLYRLPREAEWEYSCRGGATSQSDCDFDFYFAQPTNDLSSEMANFDGQSPAGNAPQGKYLKHTSKVGSYQPNRLGLYDMHGNVWEWCEDQFKTGGSARVIRGGCWKADGVSCRASLRNGFEQSERCNYLGLRLAAVPSGE
jgi:formylglycine-generating enzyme required for sulfatase activity